jgi:hypothetical protein
VNFTCGLPTLFQGTNNFCGVDEDAEMIGFCKPVPPKSLTLSKSSGPVVPNVRPTLTASRQSARLHRSKGTSRLPKKGTAQGRWRKRGPSIWHRAALVPNRPEHFVFSGLPGCHLRAGTPGVVNVVLQVFRSRASKAMSKSFPQLQIERKAHFGRSGIASMRATLTPGAMRRASGMLTKNAKFC